MQAKPTDSQDGVDLDHTKIQADLQHFNSLNINMPIEQRLHKFIQLKQQSITTGLTLEKLAGFEGYEKFAQLKDMAINGLQPFLKPDFVPNRGRGDFRRDSQHRRLRHTIAQHVRKLQDHGRCFIMPRDQLDGVEGFHLSALHVASKAGDPKGRPCSDTSHSGLNAGTDMEALNAALGDFKLPQLKTLARMLAAAQRQGNTLVHKTDVTSAFNNMLLSPQAALLQTFLVGDLVIIPLVAGFGWSGAPAYYNVIAGAINWAHNGGIKDDPLDTWAHDQGSTPAVRNPNKLYRSMTYVDDTCGQSSTVTASGDMADLRTIICQLLGTAAYNVRKTEGPDEVITIIGWECDLRRYTIRPGAKGQCKLYYWAFRGLSSPLLSLHDLQSAVGTFRWYSAVVPMASTFELQRLLTATQARHAAKQPSNRQTFCRLTATAQRELDWWQWLLSVNLTQDMLETPVWYLAHEQGTREHVHAYTDASGDIGGGYFIPDHTYSQFKWSMAEKTLYGRGDITDINGLEFVTAICAIIANRDLLRGKVVHLHVDNTSAVSWINKQRTSQLFGQAWIRILITVMLTHDILIDCTHIAGVLNVYADALSRYLSHQGTASLIATLREQPMLSAASRQHIWSMSSTPRSTTEYLATLETLERQDFAASRTRA